MRGRSSEVPHDDKTSSDMRSFFDTLARRRPLSNRSREFTQGGSLVDGDSGNSAVLSGGFFTLTVGSSGEYSRDFICMVTNDDSDRGKTISIDGLNDFILWPRQSVIIFNGESGWNTIGPGRWVHPGGTLNLYADFTNGDDANDGLASGAGNAKKTAQNCLDTLLTYVDFNGLATGPTLSVVNLAANTSDTQGVHFSAHTITGAAGGAAVRIKGATGASIDTTGTALGFFCNAQVQIQGPLTITTTTSGDCIVANLGARVELLDQITFGACAADHMTASNMSTILIDNDYTVSGSAAVAHQLAQANSLISNQGGSITVTITADLAMTYWTLAGNMGQISMPSVTYSLGGHTVTGKRYEADNLSLIYSGGGGANYFPGDAAGSTSVGGQYA